MNSIAFAALFGNSAVPPRSPPARCSAVVAPPPLASLPALAERYDAFLLDQFGVIHDGADAFPGAVEAVSFLLAQGKRIVIISNSSRRKGDTAARLRRMGFGPVEDEDGPEAPIGYEPDPFAGLGIYNPIRIVTSGELCFEGLRAGRAAPFAGLGPRVFCFGNGADDEEYVRECGLVPAPIGAADFILARGLFTVLGAGPDLLRQPALPHSDELETEVLRAALARAPGGLPMLVANPDEVRPDGADSPMPGVLARRYREMGGADVRLVGKPHPLIYAACRDKLAAAGVGDELRVAAVGDSLHHDILGAARNGFDSILVCGGVHCQELGVPPAQGVRPEPARLSALLRGFAEETGGVAPTHVLASFSTHVLWGIAAARRPAAAEVPSVEAAGVAVVEVPAAAAAADLEPVADLASLTVELLKQRCRARGLPVGGRKADLVARLGASTDPEREGAQ